jgi:hypothetical protein
MAKNRHVVADFRQLVCPGTFIAPDRTSPGISAPWGADIRREYRQADIQSGEALALYETMSRGVAGEFDSGIFFA